MPDGTHLNVVFASGAWTWRERRTCEFGCSLYAYIKPKILHSDKLPDESLDAFQSTPTWLEGLFTNQFSPLAKPHVLPSQGVDARADRLYSYVSFIKLMKLQMGTRNKQCKPLIR
ncbi:hypothetical protein BS47DRAFT_1351345 [Hydnum rufescens UP504]|uniref:Uncharacterized protein n=1 Tax=Hydnum rufescens UP504 TaxID=1448309 RepID=A0A9P6DN56_9AGAM|nr:hypothetical protein BS47DRAFT_1351345 [Hydnum rufescens UP504]